MTEYQRQTRNWIRRKKLYTKPYCPTCDRYTDDTELRCPDCDEWLVQPEHEHLEFNHNQLLEDIGQ